MRLTTFKILKMDCPSEEQIIRMKLSGYSNIISLDFDIPNRQLSVFHHDSYDNILLQLDSLNYDTSLINSVETNNYITNNSNTERKLLWQILIINFFFFLLELITGFIANSMGLVADSLDMLADSFVYGLAIFAAGGSLIRKKNIAKAAGYFQLILAILGFVEIIRRFAEFETVPSYNIMIFISILALTGNSICLYLLQKSKNREAHIQASLIFTSNDVIANLGVIIAGAIVYFTNSKYPDLIIGTIVFFIVGQGALKILKLSK